MTSLQWLPTKPFAPFGSDEQSNYAPAATVHNGKLWVVWNRTGSKGAPGLYCASTSMDATGGITTAQWNGPTQMQDEKGHVLVCTDNPAVCDVGGRLQVIFPANTSSGKGYPVHYSYDDVKGIWIQQEWASSQSLSSVSLAVYRGEMYCAFRGNNNLITLGVWTPPSGTNGGSWINNYTDSHTTDCRPALFVALDSNEVETLSLVWSEHSSGKIRQASFSNWQPWPTEPTVLPFAQEEKTSAGLTAFSGAYGAYLAFRKHNQEAILVCVYKNGVWQNNQAINQATKANIAIVAFQNNVHVFFTSSNGSPTLFVVSAQVNGILPSNWMATLDSTKSIAQYTLPGTHDSAAGTLLASWGDWLSGAQTQTLDIYHQLLSGIRFLDLRVDLYAQVVHCFHGVFPLGITLDAVFRQLYQFLDVYTSEAVIVSIKHEGFGVESDETLWSAIASLMNQPGRSKYWWNFSTQSGGPGYTGLPTLQQAKGKIILMRRSDYPFPFGIPVPKWPDNSAHGTVFLPPTSSGIAEEIQFQDQYDANANTLTEAIEIKKKIVDDFLRAQADMGKTPAHLGHVLMMNFSSAASNVWNGGYSPNQIATGDGNMGVNDYLLYRFQSSTLATHGIGSFPGIIIMDYPEFPQGALISSIYNQNFK